MEELIAYYPWLAYSEDDASEARTQHPAGDAAARRYAPAPRPRERFVRRSRRPAQLEPGYSVRHLLYAC
jgi:hypothetical protein